MSTLFLILSFITAGIGNIFMPSKNLQPKKTVNIHPCYLVEPDINLTLPKSVFLDSACKELLGDKKYTRIRRKVKVINGKTDEERGDTLTCKGSDSLRKIATFEDKDLYWVPVNHMGNDISNIIMVLLHRDGTNHYFDVYIDDSLIKKLPDFITNCQETGGVVPVLEDPAAPSFPPQIISLSSISDPDSSISEGKNYNLRASQNFDSMGFETNYDKNKPSIKNKYYIRLEENKLPEQALQIGVLNKSSNQEKRKYDVYFHGDVTYLSDPIDKKVWLFNPSETKPPLVSGQRNPSLQLGVMRFITTSEWTWTTPNCKPAIYLYPEKPTEINVKLNLDGKLTVSDPVYNPTNGWNVLALPDGTIKQPLNMTEYPYLYYEADLNNVNIPKEGWVVEKSNLKDQISKLLNQIGFNGKETDDFLSYWLPRLTEKPYYFITLLPENVINEKEKLTFSSTPDTLIRTRFVFEGLDYPMSVAPLPNIPSHSRTGFTVTDWGGTLVGKSCSDVSVK